MSMIEIWKDIPDYKGHYEISNLGRVKSIERTIHYTNGRSRKIKERILKQCHAKNLKCAYWMVCFRKDGKQQSKMVHRLLAEAFIPNPENLSDVNHKDGVKLNNDLSNLEWIDRKGNMNHAFQMGLSLISQGENHYLSKLTEDQVKYIRSNRPESNAVLARRYGVSEVLIGRIMKRLTWKHI